MTLRDVLQKKLTVATEKTKLKDVAKLMYQDHVGAVVIIDSEKKSSMIPVGIVTDRDIALAYGKQGRLQASLTAKDVMSKNIILSKASDGIYETVQKMKGSGVRRMPVVESSGNLLGIVTLDDLIQLIGSELQIISGIMREEVNNEIHVKKKMKDIDSFPAFSNHGADYSLYPPLM